jgi:hypothetical protein
MERISRDSETEAETTRHHVLNLSVVTEKNAYDDLVGEEVGERRDAPVADVGLGVDVEVLEPHLDCRVVDADSANIKKKRETFLRNREFCAAASNSF